MKQKRYQRGSATSIVIIVLVVALLCALGVVLYQRYTSSKQSSTVLNTSQKTNQHKTDVSKSYCAQQEKLCFNYPKNWTVTAKESDPINGGVADTVKVSDVTGRVWLTMTTGMGGIGGTCGTNPNSRADILKSQPTAITGQYLVTAPGYTLSTVSAIKYVTFNGTVWNAGIALSNGVKTNAVGTIGMCDLGMNVFSGKNVSISYDNGVSHGDVSFMNQDLVSGAVPTTYSSEADATAAISSDNADLAYQVISSAHY